MTMSPMTTWTGGADQTVQTMLLCKGDDEMEPHMARWMDARVLGVHVDFHHNPVFNKRFRSLGRRTAKQPLDQNSVLLFCT